VCKTPPIRKELRFILWRFRPERHREPVFALPEKAISAEAW